MKSAIANKLLRWYATRRRNLPWREHPKPYAVWVAEIMAQQTRLESVLPFYWRWMQRFPTVRALANAKEQQVLSLWEGLGYYSRARNLRLAAQIVMSEHGGKLPRTADALMKLPGIGRYTAGAIASLAFGADVPAVDGNAMRVLARVFNVNLPMDGFAAQRRFWALAAEHLPRGRAADYNQALMDLGAEICTPRGPKCSACPLRRECRAKHLGIQEQRPVKGEIKSVPVRHLVAAIVQQGDRVLVLQRPARGLLAGMWGFPTATVTNTRRAKAGLRRALRELDIDPISERHLGDYEHQYSHFTARLRAYHVPLNGSRPGIQSEQAYRWIAVKRLGELPMGKLDRTIAKALRDVVA